MRLRLEVLTGPDGGRTTSIRGEHLTVGREASCGFVLSDPAIADRHAIFERLPTGGYSLRDLGSGDGTFVNGRKLEKPVVLTGREQIRFGSTIVGLRIGERARRPWWRARWAVPAALGLALVVGGGTVAAVVVTQGSDAPAFFSGTPAAGPPLVAADSRASTGGSTQAVGATPTPTGPGVIAFEREGSDGSRVLLMNSDGSGQVPLTSAVGSDPAVSLSGTRIAFVGAGESGQFVGGPAGLYVVDRSGGSPSRVGGSAAAASDPGWSPDGSELAAAGADGGLTIVSVDGAGGRTIGTGEVESPAWSPDGSTIAVAARVDSKKVVVGTIRPNGSRPTPLVTLGPLDPGVVGLDWSPDGRRIALTCVTKDPDGVERPDVCVMNADGSGLTALAGSRRSDFEPSFSPDGSRIAFVSNRDGNDEIYVMAADGSRQRRLTVDPAADRHPSWGGGPPLVAGSRSVVLVDDFSDPGSGWETFDYPNGSSAGYRDGAFVIEVERPALLATASSGQRIAAGRISTLARTDRAVANAGFGLICAYRDQRDFDALGIAPNGTYAILRWVDGKQTVLGRGPWSTVPAGSDGYRLDATCGPRELVLRVDGTVVARVATHVSPGTVGLFVQTSTEGGARVRFDDVVVERSPTP